MAVVVVVVWWGWWHEHAVTPPPPPLARSGLCVCARGDVDEKAAIVFEAFDFNRRREMSLDELTIAFICTLTGAGVVAAHNVKPTERGMEQMARRLFADVRPPPRAPR